MILFPNCKINLGLFVTNKRPDGFHNLETVFYSIGLTDALEIVKSDGPFEFSVSGLNKDSLFTDNICVKAYEMLKEAYSLPSVKMHLHKHIPVGSGLGGGSSDAVSVLKILDSLFKINMSRDDMYSYARRLGSDCAFFIDNTPCLALEKGDIFEDIAVSLAGLHLVVVVPPLSVSTADAYKNVKTYANREALRNIIQRPINEWRYELYNDFEYTVFEQFPRIEHIKEKLYKAGAVYASMSGSGSAVYGLFNDEPPPMKFKDCFVWQEVCGV